MTNNIAAIGTSTAVEIFIAVGSALSWWESAEDILLGLYKLLQADHAPEMIPKYVKAVRGPRARMMSQAVDERADRFEGQELEIVRNATAALTALANRRNEITHGHCTEANSVVNGVTVMKGHYLHSAWHENKPIERIPHNPEPRFALTADDIRSFETAVRDARWAIFEVYGAILMRKNQAHMATQMHDRQLHEAKLKNG